MRPFLTILALILMMAPACRADEYDDDGKEGKKADAKHGKPEDEIRREKERWEAWVKKLGDGPLYRVEVLFRPMSEDNILYFLQHYVSPTLPTTHGMPGLGLDGKGKFAILPDSPIRNQLLEKTIEHADRSSDSPLPPLPLAKTTRSVGVSLKGSDVKPGTASIHVGDVGSTMKLPVKVGDAEVLFFHCASFRIERVSVETVLKAGPLRQDAKYYRERSESLKCEMLKSQQDSLTQIEDALVDAAFVFRDLELIDGVRQLVERRTVMTPVNAAIHLDAFRRVGTCLAILGDDRDFEALRRLVSRHPDYAPSVMWTVLPLVERVGATKAIPLIEDLLKNPDPHHQSVVFEVLRELNPKIPEFNRGDLFLVATTEYFHLKPLCYELRSGEQQLETLCKTQPLTALQKGKLGRGAINGDYLFMTEADRKQGVELILDWYKQYQPPANK